MNKSISNINKFILLPKLSAQGIKKNGATYVPYIIAGIFSVFIFFVFSSIMHNDIMETVPHSSYVKVFMWIGLVLLGMILIPFLIYTNSFLIKRRKKELGLYSILGLEKKHIAIMMLWETLIIFSIVVIGGILFGVVFSKLLFLVLLNLSGMSADTAFFFSFGAFKESILYFLFVYGLNLIINLFEVLRSNPSELMKGAKKGDKEPKHLWIPASIGILFLAAGYYIAIVSEVNSMIFMNFFFGVVLVTFGTHYFFTGGIIALLKILKGNKKFYYHKSNYVTLSGMLHRMKKSASSLSNICIFSTMTIITLLCTLSLWSGTSSILNHQYPYDMTINFNKGSFDESDTLNEKLQEITQSTKVELKDKISFTYQKLHVEKVGKSFIKLNDSSDTADQYGIKLISLYDFNQMEQKTEELADNELIIFSTGADFGYESVLLGTEEYKVKKELDKVIFTKKATNDTFGQDFYLIVKDETVLEKMRTQFESFKENDRIYTMRFQIEGNESNKEEFINKLITWGTAQKGFNSFNNGISNRQDTVAMNGGLLFIGIFFGIVFSMCLVLMMYYKQITEGFDDRENFNIMQKVGMSDKEVRSTIKRQIVMVFFLPLVMAGLHTMAAFGMISKLFGALHLFDTTLIAICGISVVGFFAILYGLSYLVTSKTYYGIVKQMK